MIDDAAERERLTRQIAKTRKELEACERKLANPRFVQNAPDTVVTEQREREAHYRAGLEALQQSLRALG